ncbi:hypothetical protein FRB94_002240 [Tulasnella sp. JGI-2019a]|nr:hypothetical protein FRB94_002240 [Tulasnella sp. JGI-2019a]KAG9021915.1 hypothetical protein FRB95_001165 [Tulasnella sp. JGI-2019a]
MDFKAKKVVTTITKNVERPEDVQRDYNLNYALSEHGVTFNDLEVEAHMILDIHYDNFPTLPYQLIDKEVNAIYSILDYGTFHDQGPGKHFLVKWPKSALDKVVLGVFTKEELINKGMDGGSIAQEAVATEASQEEDNNKGKPKVKIKATPTPHITKPPLVSINITEDEGTSHLKPSLDLLPRAVLAKVTAGTSPMVNQVDTLVKNSPLLLNDVHYLKKVWPPPSSRSCLGINTMILPCCLGNLDKLSIDA